MKRLLIMVPFILVLIFLKGGHNCPWWAKPRKQACTPEVKQLLRGINDQIKSQPRGVDGGLNVIGRVKPISYKSQVVNGVNYFVKVRARTLNKNVFYHLRIYQGFNKDPAQLVKVEGPKRKRDAITYF